jgi:ZIP family zinc transporter
MLGEAIWLSLGAGFAITLGALVASVERINPEWLKEEFRHFVIAFGGGALLSAVALVLVPDGILRQSGLSAILTFLGGGLTFMALDIWLSRREGSASQFMAMMLDFVPEAIVLGAVIASDRGKAILIAVIIAAQNFPEGFNAYREIRDKSQSSSRRLLAWFLVVGLSGPLYVLLGTHVFVNLPIALGMMMTFCAGGILYLVFQDIAPQATLDKHWLPTLGAVLGFLVGMIGHILTRGAAG